MNCDLSASGPGTVTGAKALHAASEVGVLPVRTLIETLTPAGVAINWMLCQSTGADASKMREVNVPPAAYDDMRIQSTNTVPPNGLKSLAATGRIGWVMVSGWVTTSAPST